MSESNATELIKYLTEDNLKLMYGRLNRRYVVVDALPSVDSLEPADKNVIYVVKETVGKAVRYWPNVLDNDAWKPFGIDQEDLDRKADKVSNATDGNFAGLDDNGNLTDSGYKASDFKPKQTAVTDPTASGSGIEFIDSISQDTNGVIVPAKKSVQVAVASTSGVGGNAGVMSAADKEKLDGIEAGAQANTIESISIKNAPLDITNKNVDIPLATADSDGLLPHEKFPLIPAEPVAGANRIYSFDDTNGTSWQTIVKEYVGNMILDQQGTPVTDEKGDIMYEEEAVPLWLSYKGVEFGARRAYDDHTGTNIHDSIEARTTMAQVTTAIETALAKYGGFVVVQLTQGADPVPDVQNPSTKLIYLTKDASSTKTDPYTEWICTNTTGPVWEIIGETTPDIAEMIGATASTAGTAGLVPAPASGDQGKVLTGDGSWSEVEEYTTAYIDGLNWNTQVVVIGGREYPYVQIGNQLWLAENLDWKFQYNGSPLPIGVSGEPTTPAAWYYDNDEATYGVNGNKYGILYNWYAVKYLEDNKDTMLPKGWRVPNKQDYRICDDNLPSNPTKQSTVRATTWANGTNSTGMTLLPVGIRSGSSGFNSVGVQKYMWSIDQHPNYPGSAYGNYVYAGKSQFYYEDAPAKVWGCAIRLVKDVT